MAESRRIEKVNELIKEEIGRIIFEETDQGPDTLITVTRVVAADDLSTADIFVTVFPEAQVVAVMKELTGKAGWLQRLLIKRLSMRPIPKISFAYDSQVVEADRIEKLLQEAKEK